ncbi:MAG: alpha/beta hydrolase [Deltaproteobacteria bacterium]
MKFSIRLTKAQVAFIAGFIVLILGLLVIRQIEDRTIFQPYREIDFKPDEYGMQYQNVWFPSQDNKEFLNGWYLPVKDPKKVVLFCHGNFGNMADRMDKVKFFVDLGCSVFIFDYQGFGMSQGDPNEPGCYKDALGAYDYLIGIGVTANQIVVYGESLGGAVAIDLASRRDVSGLIVEGTFTSIKDMVNHMYPFVPTWLIGNRFDSVSKIRHIRCPKLIIHSFSDEIIPFRFGRKLFQEAPQPKEFLPVRGEHNACFLQSYQEQVLRKAVCVFLEKLP